MILTKLPLHPVLHVYCIKSLFFIKSLKQNYHHRKCFSFDSTNIRIISNQTTCSLLPLVPSTTLVLYITCSFFCESHVENPGCIFLLDGFLFYWHKDKILLSFVPRQLYLFALLLPSHIHRTSKYHNKEKIFA